MTTAVDAMRALPEPTELAVHRVGDRLVIGTEPARPRGVPRWFGDSLLRYAASVLIAFTAGYIAHAGLIGTQRPAGIIRTTGDLVEKTGRDQRKSLRVALLSAHVRNPGGSQLANCMTALFKGK